MLLIAKVNKYWPSGQLPVKDASRHSRFFLASSIRETWRLVERRSLRLSPRPSMSRFDAIRLLRPEWFASPGTPVLWPVNGTLATACVMQFTSSCNLPHPTVFDLQPDRQCQGSDAVSVARPRKTERRRSPPAQARYTASYAPV